MQPDSSARLVGHHRPSPPLNRALLVLTLCLLVGACSRPLPPTFDNLLVIMIDTLRSDHLPSYGYARQTAPFLAELAEEGIRLPAYPTSSWTRPSVSSLFTGLPPERHQTLSRSDHLPPDLPYLPEILQREGLVTACYMGNLNVGRKWGFGRGFSHYAQTRPVGKATAAEVNAAALDLSESLSPPFFLYLHYVDPHDPYRPERDWAGRTAPFPQPRRIRNRGTPPTPDELQRLIDQYDAEIRALDSALSELFGELDRQGLLANTLVVVTSDHGEEFGEHGGLTHGRTLYEEVMRVPFLVWARQGLPRFWSESAFFQIDFLPTVLEALGRPLPNGIEGKSRWRALVGGGGTFAEGPRYFHLDLDGRGMLAALDPPRKLIHLPTASRTLAFDLQDDPAERTPLAAPRWQEDLLGQLVEHYNRQQSHAAGRQIVPLDEEARRGLEALGYLDAGTEEREVSERVLPSRISAVSGDG